MASIPLTTLLEWYKIRNLLLGENLVSRNIPLALELAKTCKHPDAHWLSNVFAGKDVKTREEACQYLRDDDARSLCFRFRLDPDGNIEDMRRAAELGYAYSQAWMAGWNRDEDSFRLVWKNISSVLNPF